MATIVGLVTAILHLIANAPPSQAETPLSIRGIDVLREAAPHARGIFVGAEAIAAIQSNIRRFELSPKAIATYRYGSDVIEGVDLERVFESKFPLKLAPEARSFTITGRQVGSRFLVDAPRLPMTRLAPLKPYEFASELRFIRNKDPLPGEALGFGIKPALTAKATVINHRYLLRIAGGILTMMSQQNLEQLRNGRSGGETMLGELQSTLPEVYRLLTKVFKLEPQIDVQKVSGGDITQVKATATVQISALTASYQALADYLQRFFSIDFRLEVENRLPSDLLLGVFTFDTKAKTFGLEYYTSNGKLIAFDQSRKLYPEIMVDPSNLKQLTVTSVSKFRLVVLGLKIQNDGVTVRSDFKDAPIATLDSRLIAMPPPKIQGRLLGVMPEWMVDWSIPGTIQGHAKTFSEGMLRANGGEGSSMTARIDTQTSDTELDIRLATEIIDNFILRIGMRIAQSYLWPNPEVIQDAWKLATDAVAALDQDMRRLLTQARAGDRLSH